MTRLSQIIQQDQIIQQGQIIQRDQITQQDQIIHQDLVLPVVGGKVDGKIVQFQYMKITKQKEY